MKILITGGAGFIGSTVSDRLLKDKHRVLIIDNYSTGIKANNSANPNLKIIEGSICDLKIIESAFSDFLPDVVLHSAASYKEPENWEEDSATNISGTINILKACKKYNTQKIIYLQTSLCYGLKPIENPITLNHPLFGGKPEGGSSYAISKTAGEQYIEMSGMNFLSFRLANVYGPRNLSGPLPSFYHRLTNNLKCIVVNTRRDFIFIDDVVNVIVKAIYGMGKKGYYHISSEKDHSIQELFDFTINNLVGIKYEVEKKEKGNDDVETILLDSSKTKKEFDWKPDVTFENGIKKTLDWYKNNSLNQTFTHLKNIY